MYLSKNARKAYMRILHLKVVVQFVEKILKRNYMHVHSSPNGC